MEDNNDNNKPLTEKPPLDTPDIPIEERNIQMFREWYLGMTYRELGIKYDLALQTVAGISKKYKWATAKEHLRKRQFNNAVSRIRLAATKIQEILEEDVRRLHDRVVRDGQTLDKDERAHLRAIYDRMLKEIRLMDGLPTEISNNNVKTTEIQLPEGVKHFGIIPADPKVKVLEYSDRPLEEQSIDLDKIESEDN